MAQFFTSYNVSDKWVVGFKKSEFNGKNIIVFGDKSYDFDEMCGIKCQITTGSYYVGMLWLDCSVDSWKVSAEDMAMVRKLIHLVDILDAQEAA